MRLYALAAGALLAFAHGVGAAQPAAAPSTAGTPALASEVVVPGLYRIDGSGGATLLRVGTNNLVVVDAKRPGTHGALMAEIQRLPGTARLPVRALFLTGTGIGQAGGAAQFADAGVPVIVSRRALPLLLAADRSLGPATPPRIATYEFDYVTALGDVDIQVELAGQGHGGADSFVIFRDLGVMAIGELFTRDTPVPDCAAGGSFSGWSSALAQVLGYRFDIAVPSRGPAVGKPELWALKAKLDALIATGQTGCPKQAS